MPSIEYIPVGSGTTETKVKEIANNSNWQSGLPGIICQTDLGQSRNQSSPVAKRAYFSRFTVYKEFIVTNMNFYLGTIGEATEAELVQMGIYNSTLSTLLAKTAEKTGQLNVSGAHAIALESTVVLTPGNIYFAVFCAKEVKATTKVEVNEINFSALNQMFSKVPPSTFGCFKDELFPLTAPVTASETALGAYPLIWLT